MSNLYSNLHNLYGVSKTLRFELKPIGKTQENFEDHILQSDQERMERFKKVKLYCDEVHKEFIEKCLKKIDTADFKSNLQKYYEQFSKNNRTEQENNELGKTQEALREKISKCFTKDEDKEYNSLFGKSLIEKCLSKFKDDADALAEIEYFKGFTTYFGGYNKNRKNMYSNKAKSTAISFRLINQNLPTFIKNMKNFKEVEKAISDIKGKLSPLLSEIDIDIENIERLFSDIGGYIECLDQGGIDKYNAIIGGKTTDSQEKLQGLNEIINEHNQQHPDKKLARFKFLHKQILSDKTDISFKFDKIENDKDLRELINEYYESIRPIIENAADSSEDAELVSAIKNLKNYTLDKDYALDKIWIDKDSLGIISERIYEDRDYIKYLLEEEYDENQSLSRIKDLVTKYDQSNERKLFKYFEKELLDDIEKIKSSYENCKELLSVEDEKSSKSPLNKAEEIEKLKDFIESMKSLQSLIKTFCPTTDQEKDELFYEKLNYDTLAEIIPVYNKVRNYVTRKSYSTEKLPLTFDSPVLLDGWAVTKENEKLGVLFEKDGHYYLGIMNKDKKPKFEEVQLPKEGEAVYRKMVYMANEASSLIPRASTKSKDVTNHFEKSAENYIVNTANFTSPLTITKEIWDLDQYVPGKKRKKIEHLKKIGDSEGYSKAVKSWINFCFEFLDSHKSTARPVGSGSLPDPAQGEPIASRFEALKERTYENPQSFYKDVTPILYEVTWVNISANAIDKFVEEGKLFLFEIYNKDFSEYSTGTPNLHTLYWKALFDKDNLEKVDEDNLKNVVYKLDGNAKVFYRKKSLEAKVTHPKNEAIINKNKLNRKKESTFSYDLIKDKRFTVDKFLFHVPITLNFKNKNINVINNLVKANIKKEEINVIGIDRGERNLIYVVLINSKGELLEQFSLNEIVNKYNNEEYRTDYHTLLHEKETERGEARKRWQAIVNIKELKEGYMSQVIHKITDLMVKHNAVIAIEDLNSGFKRSRQKIEKQVYDKFETMLANKLSYFVDKRKDKNDEGGLLNAYQLVNKDSKTKQSGVLFYVPAAYTSVIDPVTGFVNFFQVSTSMSVEKIKEFFGKFKSIRYNQEEDFFEFEFDYSKFTKPYGKRKNWTICTYGERIWHHKDSNSGADKKSKQWVSEEIELTEKFKELFEKYEIDYLSDIKTGIQNQTDTKFFKDLIGLFKLIVQLRNSDKDADHILSPVKDKNGNFYDSRNNIPTLPKDADANGAYNIARKGLMFINQIKKGEKLSISAEEWIKYIQEQDR